MLMGRKTRKPKMPRKSNKNKPLTLRLVNPHFDHSRINLKEILYNLVDQTLFPTKNFGGRLEIIYKYLEKVKESNEHLRGNDVVPSEEEIKNDLTKGLQSLLDFDGRLVGTPSLNKEELTYLFLTPAEAKSKQIKKDDWLDRLFKNTPAVTAKEKSKMNENILKWLSEMKIDDEDLPLTPIPRKAGHVDGWLDLSIIYANAIEVLKTKEREGGVTELMKALPPNIPTTYIQINVGKLEELKENLRKALEGIGDKLKDLRIY